MSGQDAPTAHKPSWWRWAVGVVLVAGAVGVWVSPDRPLSAGRFVALALGLGIYTVMRFTLNTPRRFWIAFSLLPLLALGVAALGFSGTFWLTYKLPLTDVIVRWMPRLPENWLALAGPATGLHPNPMSALLDLLILPLIGLVLFAAGERQTPGERRLVVAAAAAIVVVLIYLALAVSRSALLALAVAGMVLAAQRSRRLAWGVLAIGTGLLIAGWAWRQTLAETLFFSDLLTPETYPGSSRLAIWPYGLRLLGEAPLTGIGLGAFPALAKAAGLGGPETIAHAHNLVLQAALDLGIPGALAYISLVIEAGVRAASAGRKFGYGLAAGAAFGLAAGVLALLLFGLVDAITVSARAGVVVWFVLGLAAAVDWRT
jgi:putative inorganic carbon (HCO3(-)) transporter